MRGFIHSRCIAPIEALLTQGLSPRLLAMSVAVGAIVGIFPVLGTTTLLCTAAATVLRLNLVAVQTVHFLLSPVQLLLIIPFVRVGEWLLGSPPQPLSVEAGLALIANGALEAAQTLKDAIVHAVAGWLLVGPAALGLAYLTLARWLDTRASRSAASLPSDLPS